MSGQEEGVEVLACSCAHQLSHVFSFLPSSVILTLTSMLTLSVVSMYSVAPLIWYICATLHNSHGEM